MANIKAKLGNVDISNYLRVNEGEGLDFGSVDFLSPGFSDSALFEGQSLVNVQAKNKEIEIPLYVSAAPAGTTPLTNLCPNPNFNIDLTGWGVGGPFINTFSVIASRVQGGFAGPWCMKVQTPGILSSEGVAVALPTLEAGVTYTASVWLKGLNGSEPIRVSLGDGGGAGIAQVSLTNQWQRVSFQFAPSFTMNDATLAVAINNQVLAATYFISGVQVTQTAAAVNYFDGDSKGALWNGPPTTSTSTQVIGSDGLHSLIAAVNRELRKVNDLGLPLTLEWNNAQATNSTFFQVQFGRFEPAFVFRVTERGWLAGKLHLWTYPYGNTATQRSLGTYTATGAAMVASAPLLAAANAKQEILNDQPVAYYRFGEAPQSKPTLVDFMGVAHGQYGPSAAVTLGVTGPLQPGDTNTGVKFDGASGCATVPDQAAIRLVAPLTFMAWVNQANPTTAAGVQTIVAKGPSNDFEWRTDNGVPNFLFGAGAPGSAISFLPLNVWNHIAVSYDGAGVVYYLNGRVDATRAIATSVPTSLGAMCIGSDQGARHFNGAFDELSMFPKVLSPQRIQQHYLAGPRPNALVGDVGAQVEAYAVAGSYVPDDGRIVVMSALPDVNYKAIIPPAQFATYYTNVKGLSFGGASGSLGSQSIFLASGMDPITSNSKLFTIFLSPASAYIGDNRVLGLARSNGRQVLVARDGAGNSLNSGALASCWNGFGVIDYGVLRVPTWAATIALDFYAATRIGNATDNPISTPDMVFGVATGGLLTAVGPGYLEHGPVMVLPEARTEIFLDQRSQLTVSDSLCQGPLTAPGGLMASSFDLLGNAWNHLAGTSIIEMGAVLGNGAGGGAIPTMTAGDRFEWLNVGTGMIDCIVEAGRHGDLLSASSFVFIGQANASIQMGAVRGANYFSIFANGQAPGGNVVTPGGAPSIAVANANSAQNEFIRYSRKAGILSAGLFFNGSLVASMAYNVISQWQDWRGTAALPAALGWRATTFGETSVIGFRGRALQTFGQGSYQSRDVYRLSDAQKVNTRQTPSGADFLDLSYGARGQVGVLPVPSAGGGVFVGVFPFDQGPMNDVLTAELRVRERFTYAR